MNSIIAIHALKLSLSHYNIMRDNKYNVYSIKLIYDYSNKRLSFDTFDFNAY